MQPSPQVDAWHPVVLQYPQGLPTVFNRYVAHFHNYDQKYICCCGCMHVRVGAIWIVLSIAVSFALSLCEIVGIINIDEENNSLVIPILICVGLLISSLVLLAVIMAESSILAKIFLVIYIPTNLLDSYVYAVAGVSSLSHESKVGETTYLLVAAVLVFQAVGIFLCTNWFALVIHKLAQYYDDKTRA